MTDFQKGQTVTFDRPAAARPASDMYGTAHQFEAGDTATVSTVRKGTITVKTRTTTRWNSTPTLRSYNVDRSALRTPNGEAWDAAAVAAARAAKPKPRKLFEVPEGSIDPNDPGLLWFWDDVGKFARGHRYCSTFDTVLTEIGVPGRKREFNARTKIGNIAVVGTVEARSQKEADALFAAAIAAAK